MLDNLMEMLSVVQDGLSSNSNLRQMLSEAMIRWSELQKPGYSEKSQVHLGAGAELLSEYQRQWAELHSGSEGCAAAAEQVDRLASRIHEQVSARLTNTTDLCQSLSGLPKLSAAVDECINHLGELSELIVTVEKELSDLEDLVDRHETAKRKVEHHYHLSQYKERKLAALEEKRVVLAAQSSVRHAERERKQMSLLQGRSQAGAEAFTHDVAHYLATGAPPPKLPSPAQTLTLEQVELEDTNREDLDAFLDS